MYKFEVIISSNELVLMFFRNTIHEKEVRNSIGSQLARLYGLIVGMASKVYTIIHPEEINK